MENNYLKENIRKNIKERIAISNIREEFYMEKNNKKVIYSILTACAVFILCIGISMNINNTDAGKIAKQNNVKQENIVFNTGSLQYMAKIDANSESADLKDEFNFINTIYVPEELKLSLQSKIFVKENSNSSEYSKLWQYEILYLSDNTDNNSYVKVTFTGENHILGCTAVPDEENTKNSQINGKEVKLFKEKDLTDESKIVGEAFFENNGYKFYVQAQTVTEEEFINIVSSILK